MQHCLTLALSTPLQGLEGPNWWQLVAPADRDPWRRHAGCDGVDKYLFTPHFKDLQVGRTKLGGISQASMHTFLCFLSYSLHTWVEAKSVGGLVSCLRPCCVVDCAAIARARLDACALHLSTCTIYNHTEHAISLQLCGIGSKLLIHWFERSTLIPRCCRARHPHTHPPQVPEPPAASSTPNKKGKKTQKQQQSGGGADDAMAKYQAALQRSGLALLLFWARWRLGEPIIVRGCTVGACLFVCCGGFV